jgi:HprK-related kinase A
MQGPSFEQTPVEAIRDALRSDGLALDLGAMTLRLRSGLPELAALLQRVYPHLPFATQTDFVDTEARLFLSGGVRRLVRQQVRFEADGIEPFEPFARGTSLPLLEWGINWCFAHMFGQHLLLHAGVVEIAGGGLLLIASPGSGKSTLTAALGLRGARVLSDEFGVLRLGDLQLLPIVKPVSLKNRSIDVIRAWSPDARFGPVFPNTRKGDVAHLALGRESSERRSQPVRPRVLVFPKWSEGARLSIEPLGPVRTFATLASNSFNYALLGPDGFDAVEALVDGCRAYRLAYGSLDEAVPALIELCGQ